MTTGEKLLNLTTEYQQAVTNRAGWDVYGSQPAGREPVEIAAEYEAALRELLVDVQGNIADR